jgi:Fe-S-cluster containining protein
MSMDTYNEAEKSFMVIALKEEAREVLWKVGSNVDPDTLIKSCMEDLQAIAPRQDGAETRSEEEIWRQVRELLLKAAYATRPHCIRCGVCCSKGSPTLLKDDVALLRSAVLRPEHLVTIRRGELAYCPQEEKLMPSETELIKIKETPGSRTCCFFRPGDKECSIYESRPAQCRQQECWNTQSGEEIGKGSWLNRQDLLQSVGQLWAVIQRHEDRCSYDEFNRIMARLEATKGSTVGDLLELLRFDHHVRQFLGEKLGIDTELMVFFFGRPLTEAVEAYGLTVESDKDGSFVLTTSDTNPHSSE